MDIFYGHEIKFSHSHLCHDWLINKGYKQMTPKRYMEFNEETTKEIGIYIITIGWKKKVEIQRTFKGLLMTLLIILNPTL